MLSEYSSIHDYGVLFVSLEKEWAVGGVWDDGEVSENVKNLWKKSAKTTMVVSLPSMW